MTDNIHFQREIIVEAKISQLQKELDQLDITNDEEKTENVITKNELRRSKTIPTYFYICSRPTQKFWKFT